MPFLDLIPSTLQIYLRNQKARPVSSRLSVDVCVIETKDYAAYHSLLSSNYPTIFFKRETNTPTVSPVTFTRSPDKEPILASFSSGLSSPDNMKSYTVGLNSTLQH